MSDAPGRNSSDQRPNLWEELNRPQPSRDRRPSPPPPPPTPPTDQTSDAGVHRLDGSGTSAKVLMKGLDSQHLLLVGALLFVVVTLVSLGALGGSGPSSSPTSQPDAIVTTTPEPLAALDPTTTSAPLAESTTTTAGPTAMGLPAALLDRPQSQVYRLYRTALGREPDRSGFQYWSDEIRAGTPLETLALQFVASDEFRDQFTEGSSDDERMERLLTNAFGPADAAVQMRAWLKRYRGLEGAALLLAISEADETLAVTGTLR